MNQTPNNQTASLATPEERRRAAERPIDGLYREFAKKVRHYLGWEVDSALPLLSARDAARLVGISHTTITMMARGDRVSPLVIEQFANALGANAAQLKMLAGHLTPDQVATMSSSKPELTREPVTDDMFIAWYNGQPPEKRRDINSRLDIKARRQQARKQLDDLGDEAD